MLQNIQEWIALSRIPGVGSLRFQFLIEHFGSPEQVFQASTRELSMVKGIDNKTTQSIISNLEKAKSLAEKDLKYIHDNDIDIITYKEKYYPVNLRSIYNFPPILYVKGMLVEGDCLSIGMVGSRRASTYGILMAKKFAGELARKGITIGSGMARGIDSASHLGALENNGRTIAVLGNGIDICYPRENDNLLNKIIQQGAVITEFPLSTPPEAMNFPSRNRIISGLSLGVIVVEASEHSGALITSDLALEQGREVFAIPGNVTVDTSSGSNRLIKQGAKLITSVDDILEEISPIKQDFKLNHPVVTNEMQQNNLSEAETKIMNILSLEPIHMDDIAFQSNLDPSDLPQYLLNLELLGLITQLSGKRFVKSL